MASKFDDSSLSTRNRPFKLENELRTVIFSLTKDSLPTNSTSREETCHCACMVNDLQMGRDNVTALKKSPEIRDPTSYRAR